MLAYDSYGEETAGAPILIVHGLFGSGRNWGVIAKRLSKSRRVVSVDMRNHGDSPRADSQSYHDMADDLAQVIESLGGEALVVGHSMGGKASMVLALTRPELVRALIVADIAPVAYEHTQAHLVDAMQELDPAAFDKRSDADAALARKVETKGVRDFLLQSLDLKEKRWKLNLDVLGSEMDKILSFPDLSASYDGPTLFLAGAESDYVLPEHRDRIKALFPNAKQAKIPGAGHWLHAEKPREFEAAVRAFFTL
ncbi:alpha/beta fold hydrolase [Maritimibacter sp. DP1N21-5]|uniref:alpha/beta fold hydrolase n=1 Tax=Maritimibacter sp. DP1N21-5 TaxID=2836867 RepID=UPI001C466FD8|nr:alpha/beta fold hydrolase [Maritimibacter sp. DP1N21-5]MBV7409190.1 alpha/beta fold hydrolase [Maritimibacter sp. DP1N21-5]